MKTKNYKITFCLSAGYAGVGKIYTAKFAEKVIEQWMTMRLKEKLPTVSGVLSFGKLFFPANGRRKDGKLVTVANAGVYEGAISSMADAKRKDEEIRNTLISLATTLKEKLQQEKVYIIYKDKNWFV